MGAGAPKLSALSLPTSLRETRPKRETGPPRLAGRPGGPVPTPDLISTRNPPRIRPARRPAAPDPPGLAVHHTSLIPLLPSPSCAHPAGGRGERHPLDVLDEVPRGLEEELLTLLHRGSERRHGAKIRSPAAPRGEGERGGERGDGRAGGEGRRWGGGAERCAEACGPAPLGLLLTGERACRGGEGEGAHRWGDCAAEWRRARRRGGFLFLARPLFWRTRHGQRLAPSAFLCLPTATKARLGVPAYRAPLPATPVVFPGLMAH